MSYLVLARKWRPQTFDEVVGQRPVTQTLKNAILHDRLAHALLFAGPRGVGKTTTARILAKALNCEKGPTPEPCNGCPSCREIAEGRSMDCIEIDGASNRGIDEVRELRENVRYAPASGKSKVIIIDEVHMLTEPAFNALLKTLEEPPPRVVFVLATTEPHKVPPTIHSRCQRHDFRRIGLQEMVDRLKAICSAEGIQAEEEALLAMAKAAEGSLRDAESLLDQVTAYSGQEVKLQDVVEALGLIEGGFIARAAQAIVDGDGGKLLLLVDELFNRGYDLRFFCHELLGHLRDLLICKVVQDPQPLLKGARIDLSTIKAQAAGVSVEELEFSLQILSRAEAEIRRSSFPRYVLEMALVRLSEVRRLQPLGAILERLEALEKRLGAPAPEPDLFTLKGGEVGHPRSPVEGQRPETGDRRPEIPNQSAALSEAKGLPSSPVPSLPSPVSLEAGWAKLKKELEGKGWPLASLAERVKEVALEGEALLLFVEGRSPIVKATLENGETLTRLETLVAEAFGQKLSVECRSLEKGVKRRARPAASLGGSKASEHPLVKEALELFEGHVVKEKGPTQAGERDG